MLKIKTITGISLAVLALVPALAQAEARPSYANKKSGKVVFADKEDQQDGASSAASDQSNDPSAIEPAAGADATAQPAKEENSLAEQMKLPRK